MCNQCSFIFFERCPQGSPNNSTTLCQTFGCESGLKKTSKVWAHDLVHDASILKRIAQKLPGFTTKARISNLKWDV